MPAYTYVNDRSFKKPTGDKAIDDLLLELRTVTKEDWRVGMVGIVAVRGLFRRRFIVQRYTLYHVCRDSLQAQVINFYRDGSQWTINHAVPAELIVGYMYGYLAGYSSRGREF
jgi:hypothetical protein